MHPSCLTHLRKNFSFGGRRPDGVGGFFRIWGVSGGNGSKTGKKTRSDDFQRNLKGFSQNYGFTYVYLVRKNGKMYDRVVPWTKLSIFRVVDDIIWNFCDFTTNSYDFIFITDAPELTDKCCNVY